MTYSTTMLVLADVKKLAQNIGVSYSGSMKPAKSKTYRTCPKGTLETITNHRDGEK